MTDVDATTTPAPGTATTSRPSSTSRPAPPAPAPSRPPAAAADRRRTSSSPPSCVGIGFVVFQGLGNATLYFRNADEAVAERDDLGTRRFRLQGLVQRRRRAGRRRRRASRSPSTAPTSPCVHAGDPPDLFQPGIPVVLEGHFVEGADTFASDRILVKHSEEYEAENPDRIVDAEDGARTRDGPMNLALGRAGVVLGLVAAVFGVIAARRRPRRGPARACARTRHAGTRCSSSAAPLLAVVRHGAGAHHPRLLARVRRRERLVAARRRSTTSPRCGPPSRARSCCGASCCRATSSPSSRKFRDRLDDPLVGWALLTMFVVAAFFFALMLGPANPFRSFGAAARLRRARARTRCCRTTRSWRSTRRCSTSATSGSPCRSRSPSPRSSPAGVGEGWLVATRRWTLFAWGFLTVGIVLGAWWSYEVLGWGGYWAWDPVENACFLPWLTGTAYLHSVMVQERRGMLRVWNLSLLCATFALTILGTFLTRSGVLDSVHAFTESLDRPVPARLLRRRSSLVDVRAHRLAGRRAALARAHRRRLSPRGRLPRQQPAVRRLRLRRAARHGVPAARRGDQRRPHLGRRAVLRPHDDADRPRPAVPHGGRAGAAVAQGVGRDAARRGCTGRRGSAPARVVLAVAPRRPRPGAAARLRPRRVRRRRRAAPGRRSPPAARAGAASSAGPTAGWSCTSASCSSPSPSPRRQSYATEREVTLSTGRDGDRRRPHRRARRRPRSTSTPQRTEVAGAGRASTAARSTRRRSSGSASGTQTIGTPSVRTGLIEDVYLALARATPRAATVDAAASSCSRSSCGSGSAAR